MAIQRRHFRIPVSRRGLITKNDTTTLCELVDITEEGLHFSSRTQNLRALAGE
jgi:hypothetical protein